VWAKGVVRVVPLGSIRCVVRRGRRTVIGTDDEDYPTYYTVAQMESRLAPHGFYRINSGTLVNLECVRELVSRGDGSYDLGMTHPRCPELTVSRARAQKLLKMLKP
jgi:DNA-binding LytR/AlgR family response regulator